MKKKIENENPESAKRRCVWLKNRVWDKLQLIGRSVFESRSKAIERLVDQYEITE